MTARTVIKNTVGLKTKKEKPAKTFEKKIQSTIFVPYLTYAAEAFLHLSFL